MEELTKEELGYILGAIIGFLYLGADEKDKPMVNSIKEKMTKRLHLLTESEVKN